MDNTNNASKFFATGHIDDYLEYKSHSQNDEYDQKDNNINFTSFL